MLTGRVGHNHRCIARMSRWARLARKASARSGALQVSGSRAGSTLARPRLLLKHLPRVTNASRVPHIMCFFVLAHLKFSFVAPISQAPTSERIVVDWHVMEPNLWPAARN